MLVTLPLPYFMVEVGWVPALRLLVLAGLCSAVALTEPGSDTASIAGLLAVQALAAVAVTYGMARWMESRLRRRSRSIRMAMIAAIVGVLLVASMFRIYRTPLSGERLRTNLFEILR
jgi:hypothetical protein